MIPVAGSPSSLPADAVSEQSIGAELDLDVLSLFKKESDTLSLTAGSVVFRKGDDARAMYVVLEGRIDIVFDGRVLTTEGPGSLIGEMALVGDHVRSADAVAQSDCLLACIDERRFMFLVGQTPYFALHVMRQLGERIRRKERVD